MPRKPKDYEEVSRITIGRDSNFTGYHIEVCRKPGDCGWNIIQGDQELLLPDDDAAQNLLEAITSMLALANK